MRYFYTSILNIYNLFWTILFSTIIDTFSCNTITNYISHSRYGYMYYISRKLSTVNDSVLIR